MQLEDWNQKYGKKIWAWLDDPNYKPRLKTNADFEKLLKMIQLGFPEFDLATKFLRGIYETNRAAPIKEGDTLPHSSAYYIEQLDEEQLEKWKQLLKKLRENIL